MCIYYDIVCILTRCREFWDICMRITMFHSLQRRWEGQKYRSNYTVSVVVWSSLPAKHWHQRPKHNMSCQNDSLLAAEKESVVLRIPSCTA